jgi:MFS family permease
LLLWRFLPKEIDATTQSEVLLPRNQEMLESIPMRQPKQAKLSFCGILSNPKLFFSLFCGCIAFFNGTLLEPVLALRLLDFNFSENEIGLYFAAFVIVYTFTALSIERWPKSIDTRVYLILGFVMAILALLCSGPSLFLGFIDKPVIILIGLILLAISIAAHMVLSLPETLKWANLFFPDDEDHNSNFCSGYFNSFLGVGQITAPLFSSLLTFSIGYRSMYDVAALINVVAGTLYFVGVNGCQAFKNSNDKKDSKSYDSLEKTEK